MAKSFPISIGRKKLKGLGLDLLPFPVTTVGGLPLQVDLLEMRYKVAKGFQTREELERKERLSTELWIRHQEKIGLDVLVDGEMDRSDLINFFASRISGFEPGGTVRVYGNRYYKKPIIRGKLEWKSALTADSWKGAQRMTHKPLKAHITGPITLFNWSFNEFYTDRAEAVKDLAQIMRKEVEALAESGAKIIQIDESSLTARPEDVALAAESLKKITEGLRCYFILHFAYGDLGAMWPKLQKMPVDNFSLEMANSEFRHLPVLKKFPTPKDLTIGVVDSHYRTVETSAEIRNRMKKLQAVIPAGQLWLSSDSDLKTRTADEAAGKLTAIVQGIAKDRGLYK